MFRLGFWIFAAAIFAAVMVFLPALTTDIGEAQAIADAVFCDGNGSATMTLTLNSRALAKGNLGALITGDCLRAGRFTSIPSERFGDVLTVLGVTALTGLMLMVWGRLQRRSAAQEMAVEAAQVYAARNATIVTNETNAAYAERTRRRDSDDARAQRSANTARAAAAAAAVPRPAAATAALAEWQIGMPSSVPAPRPASERFTFDSAAPPVLDSDRLIQLNQLQLAYESSMITRSEYDARRDALLHAASADQPKTR